MHALIYAPLQTLFLYTYSYPVRQFTRAYTNHIKHTHTHKGWVVIPAGCLGDSVSGYGVTHGRPRLWISPWRYSLADDDKPSWSHPPGRPFQTDRRTDRISVKCVNFDKRWLVMFEVQGLLEIWYWSHGLCVYHVRAGARVYERRGGVCGYVNSWSIRTRF